MAVILTICFSVLILNVVPSYGSGVLHARKGQHFQTIIRKEDFFRYENNIKFTVSMDEMPDLPGWLKFEQEVRWIYAFKINALRIGIVKFGNLFFYFRNCKKSSLSSKIIYRLPNIAHIIYYALELFKLS